MRARGLNVRKKERKNEGKGGAAAAATTAAAADCSLGHGTPAAAASQLAAVAEVCTYIRSSNSSN